VRIASSRGQGGTQFEDPAMVEIEHDFEDLVQTIMGITPQRTAQHRGMMPGGPPMPGFPFGPPGQRQQEGQGAGSIMG
jgi:hypothetical protein